jgi:ornithine cyclodeaminase
MRFVSDDEVRRHVSFDAVLSAIERCFIALQDGQSQVFDVVRGKGGGRDHFFGIKSARDGSSPIIGLKVGSYAPDNPSRGLPSHSSTTMLIDDLTGRPVAVVEANYLNGLRTSAANALAVRHLARDDSTTLGIIGTGHQAVFEALAVAHVRPIKRIVAVGNSPERRRSFEQAMRENLKLAVEFANAETASREADILVTVTPSREPVVRAGWIRPGTHVSAMGADNIGKQELDVELVKRATCWVDYAEQSVRIGEMQHAAKAGIVSVEQLKKRSLGLLLKGPRRIARTAEEITVFDSSGIAVQDLAAAQAALKCVSEARST